MPFENVEQIVRARMARIRKADTKPELVVRRVVHRLGLRFRLHRRDLPGTPDLTLPRLKTVIFVHGCFWHRHVCKLGSKTPQTRLEYWQPKLERNVERDAEAAHALAEIGWRVIVIWECEVRDLFQLELRLRRELLETTSSQPLSTS